MAFSGHAVFATGL